MFITFTNEELKELITEGLNATCYDGLTKDLKIAGPFSVEIDETGEGTTIMIAVGDDYHAPTIKPTAISAEKPHD